jgi:hypothetical protein
VTRGSQLCMLQFVVQDSDIPIAIYAWRSLSEMGEQSPYHELILVLLYRESNRPYFERSLWSNAPKLIWTINCVLQVGGKRRLDHTRQGRVERPESCGGLEGLNAGVTRHDWAESLSGLERDGRIEDGVPACRSEVVGGT